MPKTFEERGLAAIAQDLAWELTTVNNRPAYRFPIYISNGELVCHRLKFMDGHDPRYLFEPSQPKNAKYYYALSALDAIRKSETVFVCEGEPDVLTMYALGYGNTLCWFNGAKGGPASFWEDVKRMGAKRVIYIPDVDYAGLDAAAQLIESHALFTEHDPNHKINLRVLRLHGEIGTDLNDVYIANGFKLDIHKLKQWTYESLKSFAEYLKPIRKGKVKQIENRDINPAVAQAIIAKALEGGKYNHDQTRIDILSPSPHNQDKPGQHAQFFVANLTAYDYAHGEWFGTQDLVKIWGIDVESLGGWFDPEQTHQDTPTQEKQGQDAPSEQKTNEPPSDFFIRDTDALESAMDIYRGNIPRNLKAIRVPIPVIHHLGGFARNITSGKVIVLAGISGGKKTTTLENMIEIALKDKLNVMLWGGEWSPIENAFRRVQKYSEMDEDGNVIMQSATINEVLDDIVFQQHKAKGLPAEHGMTEAKRIATIQMAYKLQQAAETNYWGRITYVNNKYSYTELQPTLDYMGYQIIRDRLAGIDTDIVAFDYVQLVNNKDSNAQNQAEAAFEMFKGFCATYNVIGIMTSQVTKTASTMAKQSKKLSADDAQWIRADRSNLFITLTPVVVEDVELPYLEMAVVKNSLKVSGSVYLSTAYIDELIVNIDKAIDSKVVQAEIRKWEQVKQKNKDEKFELGV